MLSPPGEAAALSKVTRSAGPVTGLFLVYAVPRPAAGTAQDG